MSESEEFISARLHFTEATHSEEHVLLGFNLTVVTNFPANQEEIIGMVARDIEKETGAQVIFDAKEIEQLMKNRPTVYGFSNWKGSNWNPEGPPPSYSNPELN